VTQRQERQAFRLTPTDDRFGSPRHYEL
jgi:hypothetical protein